MGITSVATVRLQETGKLEFILVGRRVFGQKDGRKAHMRGEKRGLKVRFGRLTGQIDNAGNDNECPAH